MTENLMRSIQVDKVTLNIGAGKDSARLEKGLTLLKLLTGRTPSKTVTYRRIQQWGLRPGLPIGCKVTLRGEEAKKILSRLLTAKEHVLSRKNFDDAGNFAFGIHEYIEIADFDYVPEVGLLGFEVCVTLSRPGFRIKRRRMHKAKIGRAHRISQHDAISYAKSAFSVKLSEEEEHDD